jgi:hypothetical protein
MRKGRSMRIAVPRRLILSVANLVLAMVFADAIREVMQFFASALGDVAYLRD